MITEQYLRDTFIKVYNKYADDIFAYCSTHTQEREIAKYLTRNIFQATWELIRYTDASARGMKKLLYRTAKDHIQSLAAERRSEQRFYANLWNLTLSQ